MTAAAIRATFTDFAIIKTRSVMVLRFEIPIETANAALQTLGGVPLPGEDRWVAITRMMPPANPEPSAGIDLGRLPDPPLTERQKVYNGMSPEKQAVCRAGMLAEDTRFQDWLIERHLILQNDAELAAKYIRGFCGVESRANIATNPEALARFNRLVGQFQTWRDGYDQMDRGG